jgi:hypothetical protein
MVAERLKNLIVPARRRNIRRVAAWTAAQAELAEKVSPDGRVLAGPFRGMWLPFRGVSSPMSPYLAGTYERELREAMDEVIGFEPTHAIDIGAAEGYYAVGLATRLPECQIEAFESSRPARMTLRHVADRNAVRESQVTIHGTCTVAGLARVVDPGCLIISDCEGAELELLDPEQIPELADVVLVVECHDFIAPQATEKICERFSRSHTSEVIPALQREAMRPEHLHHLTAEEELEATVERRPAGMQWAVLRPRSGQPRA